MPTDVTASLKSDIQRAGSMEHYQALAFLATSLYISNQVKSYEEALDRAEAMLAAAKRRSSNRKA